MSCEANAEAPDGGWRHWWCDGFDGREWPRISTIL